MSLVQQAMKESLKRLREAKKQSRHHQDWIVMPGNANPDYEYKKPTRTQQEEYEAKHRIELMQEEKWLKEQTADLW